MKKEIQDAHIIVADLQEKNHSLAIDKEHLNSTLEQNAGKLDQVSSSLRDTMAQLETLKSDFQILRYNIPSQSPYNHFLL